MYDIIIIGSGPGGYVAAERAGTKGKKVLLIEKEKLGGVCLNWGCIPTKSLLNSAKLYKMAKNSADQGVITESVQFDLQKALSWKNNTVETLVSGIDFLMKKNKVEVIYGEAKIVSNRQVEVSGKIHEGNSIIIAAGSSAIVPPIKGIENNHVHTSRSIFEIKKLPENIIIIGGGVIGLEFASFFSMLNVNVTVIEMLPQIMPNMDTRTAKILQNSMKDIQFVLNAKVTEITKNEVFYEKDGEKKSVPADMVLAAVGRKPNTDNLGLQEIGIDITPTGIAVNDQMQTNIPGVYAIGDVTGKSLLAHSASRMGEVAVNTICGKKDRMRYNAIPWAMYTNPEAAGCGLNEQQAKEQGYEYKIHKYHFAANGRFLAEQGKAPGVCTVIQDQKTNCILGIQMMGTYSTELIFGAAIILETELRSEELKEIIFPHPTVSEVIREALFE